MAPAATPMINLSPPPSAIAAVVCLAVAGIIAIVEECWRAAHHDKKGRR